VSSRRCNLRAISGTTHPNPEGVVRGKDRPLQGRHGFSATVSVGCTYGYPRCLASQDSLPDWIWRTRHQRADARNEANLNHNLYVARLSWPPTVSSRDETGQICYRTRYLRSLRVPR